MVETYLKQTLKFKNWKRKKNDIAGKYQPKKDDIAMIVSWK